MTLITNIVKKKFTDKCKVYINEENEPILLSMDVVLKYTLGKGSVLDESEFEQILYEQDLINSKKTAHNFVSYKPRTEKQVRDKLKEKQFSLENIEKAIEFLYEFDLLDDRSFAKSFIESKVKMKNYGISRMKVEMLKRGLDKDLVEDSLKQYYPHDSSYDLALELANKKLKQLANKDFQKKKSSLVSYLQRQGYHWDVIKKILDALLKHDQN